MREVCNSIPRKGREGIIPSERLTSRVGQLRRETPSKTLPLIWWSSKGPGCNLLLCAFGWTLSPRSSSLCLLLLLPLLPTFLVERLRGVNRRGSSPSRPYLIVEYPARSRTAGFTSFSFSFSFLFFFLYLVHRTVPGKAMQQNGYSGKKALVDDKVSRRFSIPRSSSPLFFCRLVRLYREPVK